MNTLNADWDRPAAVGILHLHAAQRLVGLLGGLMFIAVIGGGIWAIQKWEHAARAKAAIAGTSKLPSQHAATITPPVPTFVTAGLFNVANPEPQTEEKPAAVEEKKPVAEEPPTPFVPAGQDEPRTVPNYGNLPAGLLGNDIETFVELPILRRMRAPRDAMVKTIQVKPGQRVSKGELLMVLSSETLEWQMIEVRGQLEIAEGKLAVLEQKKAFVQRLIEKEAASQEQFLELQAAVHEAQATLKTRKGQYDLLARAQMELNVLAPVEGKIHADDLEANLLGNPVNRGDLLLEIISAEEIGGKEGR